MRTYFKVDIEKNMGVNWFIANFGLDNDCQNYILTTNDVRCSETHTVSGGAKFDCELCAKLLNAYYNGQIELKD